MVQDSARHHRLSIRLRGYDYSQAGAYFITICTQNRGCLFGDVAGGEMRLNDAGRSVEQCWNEIPAHFPNVELDAFVIMPNHIHGVLWITKTVGARHAVPLQHAVPQHNDTPGMEQFGRPVAGSIPTIMRSFKSAVTKRINEMRRTPGVPVWQRNYYEHIIRNDESLNLIREYIVNNPLQWSMDRENPEITVGARHAVPLHNAVPLQKDEPWRI